MSTCDKCFHWTQKDPNWGACDNRNGIATENRAKLLTHKGFFCIAFSQRLTFGATTPSYQRVAEPEPAEPVSSQAFGQAEEKKEEKQIGQSKYKLLEPKQQNVWDQGGATTPIKTH